MLDEGVFGSPFISKGSSLVEFAFESINGDERLLMLDILDARGDAADTFCEDKCDGGPCE